ncbi:MAG TPA: AMP-binding protein [Aromatoleum sp.]|uniref:AMP-binding protein n=1 Tax=Aromatoleum sp. TaxID=2307007 RepID=UPI002B49B368|nr:AMP-binding protein [Aromatoleum sp.]HJV25199.1 AMP-binding protein [Aromatoleum sp.]
MNVNDLAVHAAADYRDFSRNFRLADLAKEFSGDFEIGINAAIECCDRHCGEGRIALNWEGQDGRSRSLSFKELRDLSCRFANYLVDLGIKPGDRVAGLLPRIPELLVVIIGTWRAGAVYQPLFTAFGPKAIEYRVGSSEAKLIVTDSANRSKLDDVANCPPIMTVARDTKQAGVSGEIDFHRELGRQNDIFKPVARSGEDACMMLFTSGTTGLAKGVAVPHKALRAIHMYMRYAVDLRPSDAYWNIADPGWAYGLYFGAIGPLLLGKAATFYDGPFSVDSTYRMIEKYGITNLAGAPTAYRLLIAAGAEEARRVRGRLRVVSSAGEPLNPEVIRWFRDHLGCPINDHYGQTEIGMVLCNFHGLAHEIRAGAAGLPIPGYRLAVVDEDGNEVAPGEQGTLAVDREQSPLYYFQGYWRQNTSAFVGKYYLTGDTVELGEDGSIAFVGRGDDIITSAGYRIGPFDVESCLIEHAAVAETAVVGKPDPERTEIVKAFVVLKPGYEASPALAEELQLMVKRRLAAHAYPREVEFVAELPKTPSGKIQRFLLRRQEAGGNV